MQIRANSKNNTVQATVICDTEFRDFEHNSVIDTDESAERSNPVALEL